MSDIQFEDITSYNDEKLNQVWRDVQELMEQGRVWNHKIAKELDATSYGVEKDAFSNIVLPKLRRSLEERNIIEVKEEKPEQGDTKRKVWHKNE